MDKDMPPLPGKYLQVERSYSQTNPILVLHGNNKRRYEHNDQAGHKKDKYHEIFYREYNGPCLQTIDEKIYV